MFCRDAEETWRLYFSQSKHLLLWKGVDNMILFCLLLLLIGIIASILLGLASGLLAIFGDIIVFILIIAIIIKIIRHKK